MRKSKKLSLLKLSSFSYSQLWKFCEKNNLFYSYNCGLVDFFCDCEKCKDKDSLIIEIWRRYKAQLNLNLEDKPSKLEMLEVTKKHKHNNTMENDLFTEIDNYTPVKSGFGKSSFDTAFENAVIKAVQTKNTDLRFSMDTILTYRISENMPKKPSQQIAQKFHDLVRKAGYNDAGIVHYEKKTDSIILQLSKKVSL